MSKYGGICHCLHARKDHLNDEICIAAVCECSRFKAKSTRISKGIGSDVSTTRVASLDAPVTGDDKVTLLDVVARTPEQDEAEPSLPDELISKGRAAYIEFVTRSLRATAERQWQEYILFVRGAPLTEIAKMSGYHVATVYEAVNRIRSFLKCQFGVDTPSSYQRPNTMLEYKRAKARDLLRNSRLTQKQISVQVGLHQATVCKLNQELLASGEKRGRGLQELGELCRNGHPRTEANTYTNYKGYRRCRPCWNANYMRYRKRKKRKAA